MKYDKAGTYELTYKAIDECGNESTQTRTIIVEGESDYPFTMFEVGSYSGTIYGIEGTNAYADPSDVDASVVHNAPTAEYVSMKTTIKNLVYNGENLGDFEYPYDGMQFDVSEMFIPLTSDTHTWLDGFFIQLVTNDNWQTVEATMYTELAPMEGFEIPISWDSVSVDVTGENEV